MNVVWLVGNIANDPVTKATGTGKSVSNFRVATNEGFGEEKKTDFTNIVAWGGLSEDVERLARKGGRVAIEGRISSRSYDSTKHPGEKVYVTEVVANKIRYFDDISEDDLPTSF